MRMAQSLGRVPRHEEASSAPLRSQQTATSSLPCPYSFCTSGHRVCCTHAS
jgi:hypothetical protein